MRKRITMAMLLFMTSTLVMANTLFAKESYEKVATVEGVAEYRYSNGARVLLFPDDSRPTITVNMTVLVGSRHEGYGEAGMAHLLEHLVFKGTPTFPEVPKALRDHGASFNGTTNVDRTNYFETLPATDENLEFAIHMESDRLVNSYIKREDLMSEFTVVRNEFERGENSPQSVLSQRVQAIAYEWHNYGKSTIGNRSDIERVPINNLQDFYRKFYQPDNVVLVVTGKFEEAKALGFVSKYLGSIPKPQRRLDPTYTEEPAQDGERSVVLRRVGSVGAINAVYHIPAAAHPDWAPLSILASVLSEEKVGLLDQVLVETRLASAVGAAADNSHDPGLFSFFAQPNEGKLDKVNDLLLKTIDDIENTTFKAEEIERAKIRAKRRTEQTLSNAAAMAQTLSSASAIGDWRLFFLQRDRLAAVTPEEVNRVAKTYFKKHNRTVGIFIPADAPQRLTVPAVASIADIVKEYKGGTAGLAGESFDPTPENLDARTKRMEVDGIKVAMIPKKNRGETVAFSMTLHYGNEDSLKDMNTAAGMMPMLMMSGTKTMDRQALQEKMDALGVQISAGGGRGRGGRGGGGGSAGQLSLSVTAKRESLVAGIELLGEILRNPAFASDDFEQMKLRSSAAMTEMLNDPAALAGNQLARSLSLYSKGDVRYVPTTNESIENVKNVSLEQVVEIYNKQLSSATVEIGIVGDFEPEKAVPAIEKILNNWKSNTSFKSIERTAKTDASGSKDNIVTPDKANAVFLAGLSFTMNDEAPASIPLQIGNFILGGGTLSSRLGDRIRQKEGLSYGVTSSITVPSKGSDARFTINAITNPGNIDKVENAAMEELKRFIKDGPTELEMTDSKKAFLESLKISRSADQAVAGQLTSNLNLGRSFAFNAAQESQIAKLKAEDVREAFQKYIDPKKLVVIRAGDFK